MNRLIEGLNQGGITFVQLTAPMFWQSSLLVIFLLAVDAVLRHRVRAVVRYGVWMLLLLIPKRLLQQLSPSQWRGVLLHELAHIQRHDVWVNYFQTFLQIMYFYNPLIWLAQARIRQVREQAVDEAVLVAMGKAADDYPSTLLAVARCAGVGPRLALGLVGILESGRALNVRIRRMLDRPCPTTARLGSNALILIVSAGLVVLPMAKGDFETTDGETSSLRDALGVPSTGNVSALADGAQMAALPANSSVVRVTLVDADTGKPVAKARVVANVLINPGGIKSTEATTDKKGQCQLKIPHKTFVKLGVTAYAEGYSPKGINLTSAMLATPLTLKLNRAVEFTIYAGKVLAPDGQPATNVEGVIYEKYGRKIGLSDAGPGLLASPNSLKRVEVGLEGSYSVKTTMYDEGFIFLSDAGYIRTAFTNLSKPATVILKPWARVEGTLRIGREPGARQSVDLRNLFFNQPGGFGFNYHTETDAEGRFRFKRVPPGPCEAARRIPTADPRFPDALSHVVSIEARAGETSHVVIGGTGRPVVGKIQVPGQTPAIRWNQSLHALVLQPPKAPLVDTANLPLEQRLTLAHERARAEAKYYLEFQPDGSFRADDVPPGTYRLILDVRQHDTLAMRPEIMRRYGMAPTVAPEIIRKYGLKPPPHPDIDEESNDDVITGQITNLIVVTEPPRDHPAEPLDLGTLTLQPLP